MLKLGKSKHWSAALELLTNEKKVSTKAFIKYFEPLYTWLKAYNADSNQNHGKKRTNGSV